MTLIYEGKEPIANRQEKLVSSKEDNGSDDEKDQ